MDDAERYAEAVRATAAARRREEMDPSLAETDEIRGRAMWALIQAGTPRVEAIATAEKIARLRVGGRAWARYMSHRLRDHQRSCWRQANGNAPTSTPST